MKTSPPQAEMTGTLVELCPRGYGFLYVGKRKPDYFILRSDIPPHAWVKGTVIRFTPAPPHPGTKSPRATHPEVIAAPPEGEDAHA